MDDQDNQVEGLQEAGFTTTDPDEGEMPLEEIPTEGIKDPHGFRRFPDGSILYGEQEEGPAPLSVDDHDQNLALFLEEQTLSEIGNHLKRLIEEDIDSQKEFYDSVSTIIELLGIDPSKQSGEGVEEMTDVHSSALFETLLDYTATIMKSIFPSKGPVDHVILGQTSQELEDIAKRKTAFFNYYLTQIDKGFDKELKRVVVWSILTGSIYVKVYIDSVLGRPTMRLIKVEDFVVNRDLSSHLSASRKTQIHHMDIREFDLRKMTGEYRDIELTGTSYHGGDQNDIQQSLDTVSGYDSSGRDNRTSEDYYDIYECHCDFNIKEDPASDGIDIPLPYIITLDSQTAKILNIRRNWQKEDFLKKKHEYFVNFSLLPSLDGEGYGLVQYAGKSANAATTIMRQLMKAGLYANFPGGVYQSGMRLENNNLRPAPGEFLPIQTGGVPIQQAIQPLPYKEPSGTLADLKNQIEDTIRRPSAIINHQIAEMTPRAPMGSVLSMLENMQKVPNFVIQGYHKSFEEMLELLNDRFISWLPEGKPYPFMVEGGQHAIIRADFTAPVQVIPSNDPSLQNSTYRFMRAEIILNNARQNPDIHDLRAANNMFYKNLDLSDEDIAAILPPPQQQPPVVPLDPVSENANMMQGKPAKAGIEQAHDAHIAVHQTLMLNPMAQQDQAMASAVIAHIKEHEAFKILIQYQMQMGIQLPPDPTQIPPEMQNQIAIQAAQIAQQQLEQQQQAEAQQENAEMITAKAQLMESEAMNREVEVKELQTTLSAERDNKKLILDQHRLEVDIEKMRRDFDLRTQELELKRMQEAHKAEKEVRNDQIKVEQENQKEERERIELEEKTAREAGETEAKLALESRKIDIEEEKTKQDIFQKSQEFARNQEQDDRSHLNALEERQDKREESLLKEEERNDTTGKRRER